MTDTGAPGTPESTPRGTGDENPVLTPLRIGVATMLIGALLVGAGLVATTSASPQPDCPAGTVLVSKFNFDGGNYVFEKPAGNENVVTITNGSATGGNWASTMPIAAVIVKGGPGSATATYEPPATGGSFTNADLPPVGQGNIPDISNIQFCAPDVPPPSTTTTTVKPSGNLTSLCEWDSLNYWRVTVDNGGVFRLQVFRSPTVVDLGLLAPGTYGVEAFQDGQKITTPATAGADTTKLQALIDDRWRDIKTKAANTKPCPQPTTTTTTSTTTSTTSSTTTTTEAPSSTTTPSSTTSSSNGTSSTSSTSTTTTTEAPTSSTTSSTTTTTEATTTTDISPTTTGEGTTSSQVTATTPAGGEQVSGEVAAASETRVDVTADDAQASRSDATLAFTGGNTSLMVAIGIILLLGGASLAAVSWRRERHAGN